MFVREHCDAFDLSRDCAVLWILLALALTGLYLYQILTWSWHDLQNARRSLQIYARDLNAVEKGIRSYQYNAEKNVKKGVLQHSCHHLTVVPCHNIKHIKKCEIYNCV